MTEGGIHQRPPSVDALAHSLAGQYELPRRARDVLDMQLISDSATMRKKPDYSETVLLLVDW